jgi:DNA helicase INO80
MNGYEYGHQHRFDMGTEDASMELEREMMQETSLHPKRKYSDKKRPHAFESDIGDVDSADMKDDVPGPSIKRRKLENGTPSTMNGVEHPQEQSISLKLSLSKLKGKIKQQREPSQDSASTGTPKLRKKPGPKKKTGLALEVETEQGSRPASLLGDVTPASRPGSPAPLNMTMVYELDELMPPLKKAKKVDDSILIKRIKTLEETQKKVWTNLARRDIVKVSDFYSVQIQY